MYKLILALLCLAIASCSNHDYKDNEASASQRQLLQDRYNSIELWALRCEGGVAKEGCNVGDSTLFNGLACQSGDKEACDAVAAAQGPDGKVWRAASRVGVDTENSSSRDMMLGFMLYLVSSQNREAAEKFQAYIESAGKLCEDATDGRCDITPNMWSIMYHVWGYLGLVRSTSMEINSYIYDELILTQSQFVEAGYQLHLVGVQMFILREVGYSSNSIVKTTEILVSRQPSNPFFQLVNGNRSKAAELTLEQAPKEQPEERKQWSFERDTKEQAWKDSMGHEFLSIIRLILR